MAMQGLAVVPMFAGFDLDRGIGRIFGYDVTGGRHEEAAFFTVGSGSLFARGSLKKLYRDDLDETECVTLALQALYDAADDDSATGGPGPDPADLPGRLGRHRRRRPQARRGRDRGDRRPDGGRPDARPDGPAAPLTCPVEESSR